MPILKLPLPTLIFVALIATSAIVGWFIPAFYAWTDSDQSRPSSLLWQVPVGAAFTSLAFCTALPWLPIANENANDTSPRQFRFSLQMLLWITTGVAITVAIAKQIPDAMGAIVSLGMFVYFFRFWLRNPQHRLAASALTSCMFLTYAWVVDFDELDRIWTWVIGTLAALPTIFPAVWIVGYMDQGVHDSHWLAYLLTVLEFILGLWLIQLGPKRTIAYLLLVTLTSVMGSLLFYQLCVA